MLSEKVEMIKFFLLGNENTNVVTKKISITFISDIISLKSLMVFEYVEWFWYAFSRSLPRL